MNYLNLLKNSSKKFNSIVCMGMDPVLEDIPLADGSISERIIHFYQDILDVILKKKVYPAAVKPNYAFYAQYGIEGIKALEALCALYQSEGFPVILDTKRGDIGKTAAAYARESFEFFRADAVTLSPLLGYDSIEPFSKNFPHKGMYILNKTSNKSSGELQDLRIDDTPLYLHISRKIVEWHYKGMGSVVGATYPEQLEKIINVFLESGKEVPLLIPGVGAQGGKLEDIIPFLSRDQDITLHRINSSSALNFAYKRYQNLKFAEASVKALDELNNEIQRIQDKRMTP